MLLLCHDKINPGAKVVTLVILKAHFPVQA